MRIALAAALALAIAAPAGAQEVWQPQEHMAFVVAMRDARVRAGLGTDGWWPAIRLWRCNVAASKKIGTERTGVALVGVPIEDEANEAMAACTWEADQLSKALPASEAAAIKAAIVRANVKAIRDVRDPPTVACAGDLSELCWRPWRR